MISLLRLSKRRAIASVILGSILFLNVNMHMVERERILDVLRELTQALEGGDCSIDPLSEFTTPSGETKRSLLTSYPGGKRFAWLVISALINHDVADDWNFSGKLYKNVLRFSI